LEKLILPDDNPSVGRRVAISGCQELVLIVVVRGGQVVLPNPDDILHSGDKLVFAATSRAGTSSRLVMPARGPVRSKPPVSGVGSQLCT
jgi:trk system potassium uptake protein